MRPQSNEPRYPADRLGTEETYAAWRLKATMTRRMAFDLEANLLLDVYNDA